MKKLQLLVCFFFIVGLTPNGFTSTFLCNASFLCISFFCSILGVFPLFLKSRVIWHLGAELEDRSRNLALSVSADTPRSD